MQYIYLIGCRLPPLDGYVPVCLVLTKEVYRGVIIQVVIVDVIYILYQISTKYQMLLLGSG